MTAVKAIVLICAGRTFIAGADIAEFGKPQTGATLPDIQDALEGSPKPVIAALHGTALGGGFEVALMCHYRVAVPSAKVGLPAIKLGLMPGAGGTQRLPRLAGVENALNLILSGTPFGAKQALDWKVIDALVEDGKLALKLGPKLRAFPLAHFDRDTFTYQPVGEMSAGPSGVTFRIGPDRVADAVTIENLDVHGSGTLTRVPAGK